MERLLTNVKKFTESAANVICLSTMRRSYRECKTAPQARSRFLTGESRSTCCAAAGGEDARFACLVRALASPA